MNGRALILALLGLLLTGTTRLGAQSVGAAQAITTSTSQDYSEVTCTSSDALACADALQLASDAREQLRPLLNLSRHWRFPVHIHIMMPDDPLLEKIPREASAVFASDDSMKIEAVLPSTDPDARAFIQRQYVTAMLWEKFFAETKTFDTNTKLDSVPMWLIEGLREWLNEDPEHNRESIVRRAVQINRAPTLDQVTSWPHLSSDRLMGLWQRSFSYYLVNCLIRPGPRRDTFQQWLATLSGPHPTAAQLLFPTEAGWQRELVEASNRSRAIVYTWDETAAELASADVIAVPSGKLATLDTITNFPRDKKLTETVQQKINDLTSLELRAHPSWHSILELYRFGLNSFITDSKPDQAAKLLKQAHDERAAEMENHQKLVDYVNWFEVTKNFDGTMSHFHSYFTTSHELDQAQGDPAHPNPIRANLLQIESQL